MPEIRPIKDLRDTTEISKADEDLEKIYSYISRELFSKQAPFFMQLCR